jgi:hypothetical protein
MHKASVLGPLLLGTGLLAVTACGTIGLTSADPATTGKGFSTQQYFGGYNTYGCNIGDPYCTSGALGYGAVSPYSYGYGFGTGYSPYAYGFGFNNLPVANDIFGGTTFLTNRGRFDRQPASLPYGVAEENDEAYRPLGSAIWQKK